MMAIITSIIIEVRGRYRGIWVVWEMLGLVV